MLLHGLLTALLHLLDRVAEPVLWAVSHRQSFRSGARVSQPMPSLLERLSLPL
jgi:hypothetical protein